MTTPDIYCRAPPTAGSPAPTSSPTSPPPPTLRPARLNTDRQRIGLHLTIHPRPQRLRTPTRQPGHHPEKRPPGHPQTQGKIERFHQTLKRWLTPRPRPDHPAALQNLLDHFTVVYNTERPHRALPPGTTPAQAYNARPKAAPPNTTNGHFRIRHDTVDQFGKLTLRHGSRLHHLGIGATHAHTPVLILVTTTTVTVISKTGHHVLSSHHIDPTKNYWRNQTKNPGRWPGNL